MEYQRQGGVVSLESAAFGGGRLVKTSSGYDANYFITDHLGSVRVVVNSAGVVVGRNDFMPYGGRWTAATIPAAASRYQFSGKEYQSAVDVNYSDFGARMYNWRIPRWNGIDPLAEKYYDTSPYAYCANNPVNFIDPNGMEYEQISSTFVDPRGNIIYHIDDDDPNVYEVPDGYSRKPKSLTSNKHKYDVIGTELPWIDYTNSKGKDIKSVGYASTPEVTKSGDEDIALEITIAAIGVVLADDVTVVGVANDVFILPLATVGVMAWIGVKIYDAFADHTKNKQGKNWQKHTKPRSGREGTKQRQDTKWKSNPNKKTPNKNN